MKLWKDMSYGERGDLTDACLDGKTIQVFHKDQQVWKDCSLSPFWFAGNAYRVKPEAKGTKVKPWGDLTDPEKGALLLAYHEKKVIQWSYRQDVFVVSSSTEGGSYPCWANDVVYRVKPEPVVEQVKIYTGKLTGPWGYTAGNSSINRTHAITFNVIDGEIDCPSIKIEKLK